MTNLPQSEKGGVVRAMEPRNSERRKLARMLYVELGQDNGGILLNIGEGGLAVQSALKLTSTDFSQIRFQLPSYRGWIAATGRLAWISDSHTEAGIQFLEVPQRAREQIRNWVKGIDTAPHGQAPRMNRGELPGRSLYGTEGPGDRGPGTPEPVGDERDFVGFSGVRGADKQEEPAQSFQFNNYSMFGGDANNTSGWVQAPNPRTRWQSLALLGICLAALFFVLGASVGREQWKKWIGYLPAAKQGRTAPDGAQPGDSAGATQGPGAQNAKPEPNEQAAQGDQADQRPAAAIKEDAGASTEDRSPATSAHRTEDPDHTMDKDPTGGSAHQGVIPTTPAGRFASKEGPGRSSGQHGRDAETTPPATARNQVATGRTILVNAPPSGSPPFFVNLTSEAVSASQWVAISERRSLRIQARPVQSLDGAERVTIGNLISHSDPFYPFEAGDQRIEGSVDLRATVGRTGEVIDVTAISGPSLLANAAIRALWDWRYEPTFINGDPVETQTDVTMVFRLR